jgi:uncharacterized protein YecE (DUF72 family)
MITVGCAGFAVPATRYFKEFRFVEIQETGVGVPGPGSLKRWKREAPEGFRFSLLAPKVIGEEQFVWNDRVRDAVRGLESVQRELTATQVVVTSPSDLPSTKTQRTHVIECLRAAFPEGSRVVWEAPASWSVDDTGIVARESGVLAARDLLAHGADDGPVGYFRMNGPSGFKSRYEEQAIERMAAVLASKSNEDTVVIFANIDMHADSMRLRRALEAKGVL